jgi:HEAT repeat protein
MLRPSTNEIPRLVQRLGSRSKACADRARARLSVIGPRAVDDLVEALEGGDNRVRSRVMPLLALIRDSRGRAPLTAMLLDRNSRLRKVAAQSLGRFASADSVAALKRVLARERSIPVREAATRALVEQFAGGQEQALACLLEVLGNTSEASRTRLAAFAVVPLLPRTERRALLARLRRDPAADVRRRAEAIVALGAAGSGPRPAEISRSVSDLASADYAVWNSAVHRLAALGSPAIGPLLGEMQRRSHDPEFCTRAGMALKAMGPRRGRMLANAMDSIEEPLPLQVLVEVIGAFGEKSLIYRLKDLIDRLAERPKHGGAGGLDLAQRVRAKAHLELARIGSRVAIQDLREALGDSERRIEVEMLTAVRTIGKRDEIAILLRAYTREDDYVRQEIADVVRTIMRRERIRRNNRMFRSLRPDQLEALTAILPPRVRRAKTRAVLARPGSP